MLKNRYCPSGGTGIRARLKIVSRKGCGFDSHLGHNKKFATKVVFFIVPESTQTALRACGNRKAFAYF